MSRRVEFKEDHLVKYFDEKNRIIKIEFLLSGNSCTIDYVYDHRKDFNDSWLFKICKDITIVKWSTGQEYYTYTDTDGSFRYFDATGIPF